MWYHPSYASRLLRQGCLGIGFTTDLWYFLASISCFWLWPSDPHPPRRSKIVKGRLVMRVAAKANTFAQAVPHQPTKLTVAKYQPCNWTWRLSHEVVSQSAWTTIHMSCSPPSSPALRLALTMPYQWALSFFVLLYCGRCWAHPLTRWYLANDLNSETSTQGFVRPILHSCHLVLTFDFNRWSHTSYPQG